MKTYGRIILQNLVLVAALTVAVVACNTTQQRIAANTLSATHDVVANGVDAYYIATARGLASTNGIPVVGNAYNKFQKVYVDAVLLAQNDTNAITPASVLSEALIVADVVDQFYKPAAAQIKTKLQKP